MRPLILAVTTLAVSIATPTLVFAQSAAQKKTQQTQTAPSAAAAEARAAYRPTFDDCYRLAWVRGVHVEYGELPAFNELCFAGQVPFETGNPADSIRPGSN